MPWTFVDPLPTCPFDGTAMVVENADTWCVTKVWDEAMALFGRGALTDDQADPAPVTNGPAPAPEAP